MAAVNAVRQEISTILENTYMEIDLSDEPDEHPPIPDVPAPLTASTPFVRSSSSRTLSQASLSSGSLSSNGSLGSDGRADVSMTDFLIPDRTENSKSCSSSKFMDVDPELLKIQTQLVFPQFIKVGNNGVLLEK